MVVSFGAEWPLHIIFYWFGFKYSLVDETTPPCLFKKKKFASEFHEGFFYKG
jgi:hypothetical protein